MFRFAAILIGGVIALYVLAASYLYVKQDSLVFPAERTPVTDPAGLISGARMVVLHTTDGLDLKAYYRAPTPGAPVLLYLHGNAGSITSRIHRFALMTQDGTGLLAVEYRGYGGNPGTPSEDGFARDGQAGMKFLLGQGIPPREIVAYGESLGTNVAVRTALEFPVAGLVLDAPYTSIADVAASRYPYMPIHMLLRNQFDTLGRISALKVPLLVMRTLRDGTVPPAESLTVFNAAPEPKQLWTTQQGTHSTLIETGGLSVLRGFLQKVCPQEPK
ncbi:alpha/beta hydrolase [Asaia astilbis]|uniref:alpha/beta hydrolase n=1 Tax=Asaia astilbis TaxID=610244 RepID=UPI0004713728|nr:alpha/beta fold hydrolase [Asaia astilbis]